MEKIRHTPFKLTLTMFFIVLVTYLFLFDKPGSNALAPLYALLGIVVFVAVTLFILKVNKGKITPEEACGYITVCNESNSHASCTSLAKCFEKMDKLLTVVNKRLSRNDCVLEADIIQLKTSLDKERKARSAFMVMLASHTPKMPSLKNLSHEEYLRQKDTFYKTLIFTINGTPEMKSWRHHHETIMSHPKTAQFIAAQQKATQ